MVSGHTLRTEGVITLEKDIIFGAIPGERRKVTILLGEGHRRLNGLAG